MDGKGSRKKSEKDLFDVDVDVGPLVAGVKSVVGFVFPSHDKSVRREERKLLVLRRRVELLRLQKEQDKVLKKLEKVLDE